MDVLVPRMLQDKFPLFASCAPDIDRAAVQYAGTSLASMSPRDYVEDIPVPVLYVQVRRDPWTDPSDVQSFYDATEARSS